jgi:hypothetical protein
MTAKELAQDLQNQIDSLESDYIQEIGITEEEYLDRLSYLECQLENVDIIDEIIEDYEDIDISGISQL